MEPQLSNYSLPKMDCRDFKIKFLELAENGPVNVSSDEMSEHRKNCTSCNFFFNEVTRQYIRIKEEKNSESNPFLAEKIIYKLSHKETASTLAGVAARKLAMYSLAICMGLFTGLSLNYLFGDEAELADDVNADTSAQITVADDGENTMLTLNE